MEKQTPCPAQFTQAEVYRRRDFGPAANKGSPRSRQAITPAQRVRYRRCRDLPGLIPLWPHELEIKSLQDHEKLLQQLRRALRAERQRGVSAHWSYNLTRHTNLLHAYRIELELFGAKWGN